MVEKPVVLRIKKFLKNPLLMRRQFCVDVIHPNRGNVPRKDLKQKIAQIYKVPDPDSIILFGFKTAFGGGRSSGFVLIYDDVNSAKRFEKRYRLAREGLINIPKKTGRRGTKELKNRRKKVRGTAKAKCTGGAGGGPSKKKK